MTQMTTADPPFRPEDPAAAATTDDWWTRSSIAELKAIVSRGLAAGELFDRAARELERRQRLEDASAGPAHEQARRDDRFAAQWHWAATAAVVLVLGAIVYAAIQQFV